MERNSGSTIGLGNANGGVLNFNKSIAFGTFWMEQRRLYQKKKRRKKKKKKKEESHSDFILLVYIIPNLYWQVVC